MFNSNFSQLLSHERARAAAICAMRLFVAARLEIKMSAHIDKDTRTDSGGVESTSWSPTCQMPAGMKIVPVEILAAEVLAVMFLTPFDEEVDNLPDALAFDVPPGTPIPSQEQIWAAVERLALIVSKNKMLIADLTRELMDCKLRTSEDVARRMGTTKTRTRRARPGPGRKPK